MSIQQGSDNQNQSIHGLWTNRWMFVLAATGSAVGLGNIWKFPYITGENGGGAFVLVYLLCVAVIGIPIMMTEVLLGRRGRSTPINTIRRLCDEASASRFWVVIGWFGMLAGLLILSFYSVIGGWALVYIPNAMSGMFSGSTAEQVAEIFNGLLASPGTLLFWHSVFMLMTMTIVARGVEKGIEKAVRILMPVLFVLLLVMVGYAMNLGEFARGVAFLFKPDFSALSANGVLIAMGHAFFTLSLGMGAIMIYGAYLPKDVSIAKVSIIIAVADTLVALLAGLAIFPIVFANGLEPSAGPGLIFVTLPIAFGQMPGGVFFSTLFFVLLSFAALSSAISLVEPVVTWLVENKKMSRVRASTLAGFVIWCIGIGTVLSFNVTSAVTVFEKTFFDLLDFIATNIMLPLGGLAMALFAGWFLPRLISADELSMGQGAGFRVWWFLVRYITPCAVVLVFLNATKII